MKALLFERSYSQKCYDCDDISAFGELCNNDKLISNWSREKKILFTRSAMKSAFLAEETGGILKIEKEDNCIIFSVLMK